MSILETLRIHEIPNERRIDKLSHNIKTVFYSLLTSFLTVVVFGLCYSMAFGINRNVPVFSSVMFQKTFLFVIITVFATCCCKIQPLITRIVISFIYTYKLVYNGPALWIFCNTLCLLKHQDRAYVQIPFFIFLGAIIFFSHDVLMLSIRYLKGLYKRPDYDTAESDESECSKKPPNRFVRTRSIKLFIAVNMCLLIVAFLDMSFINFVDKTIDYPQISILISFLCCFYSIIFKTFAIHFNYGIMIRDEMNRLVEEREYRKKIAKQIARRYRRRFRIIIPEGFLRNSAANTGFPYIPTQQSSNLGRLNIGNLLHINRKIGDPYTKGDRKIILPVLKRLEITVSFFVLFLYSLLPGVPFQNDLCFMFRDGIHSAIIRAIIGDHDETIGKCLFNLEEYLFMIGVVIFNSIFIVSGTNMPMFVLYVRIGVLILDSFDITIICKVLRMFRKT